MGDGSPRLDGGHLGETVRTAHSSQREKKQWPGWWWGEEASRIGCWKRAGVVRRPPTPTDWQC